MSYSMPRYGSSELLHDASGFVSLGLSQLVPAARFKPLLSQFCILGDGWISREWVLGGGQKFQAISPFDLDCPPQFLQHIEVTRRSMHKTTPTCKREVHNAICLAYTSFKC